MTPQTPYSSDLGDREPVDAMREGLSRINALAGTWTTPDFERSYAPDKWPARLILTHLAQAELALGSRVRMALTTPDYVAQSFNQDAWMARESRLSGLAALDVLAATNAMNCALFDSLTTADRLITFSHPEYGVLTVDWVIHQMAGHLIHHLKQLEVIAGG